jgi:hypothetical protein
MSKKTSANLLEVVYKNILTILVWKMVYIASPTLTQTGHMFEYMIATVVASLFFLSFSPLIRFLKWD